MATFSVYRDRMGEWRWRFWTDESTHLAASSLGYKDRNECLAALETLKRLAPGAQVWDMSTGRQQLVEGV
jgi:uncharacterized protein YegP (UPF0339 family)